MATRAIGIAALLALTGLSAAWSDPALECSTTNGSQAEIGDCLGAVEVGADAALSIALEIASGMAVELDDVTGRVVAMPALEASQSSWIAYRDAHCEAVGASFGGGSGTGIAIRSCRIELTRLRISALLDLFN